MLVQYGGGYWSSFEFKQIKALIKLVYQLLLYHTLGTLAKHIKLRFYWEGTDSRIKTE